MSPEHRELIVIHSESEIPEFSDEREEAAFWDRHRLGEEFWSKQEPEPDWLPPPRPRTSPVSIRFDQDALARLKALAKKKHKGYQTLLKEFVLERLYEEEKREGIVGQ